MALRSVASPYLTSPHRLGDVLAAIQSMGTYKFYKLDFAGWADRISGDHGLAAHWQNVFEEHPEFFRIDSSKTKASLVWRRQHPKLFHVDEERRLTKQEFRDLGAEQQQRVSRVALNADDIQSLLKTAIDLHAQAVEQKRARRWWVPLVVAAAALLGSLLGAAIGNPQLTHGSTNPTVDLRTPCVPSDQRAAQLKLDVGP